MLHGDTLSFELAISHFKDATGRPGPATWVAGDYPDGQEDYPVNGISWYEAAAYASFAGKSLPTKDHWQTAAGSEFYFYYRYTMGSHIIPPPNHRGISPSEVVKVVSMMGRNRFMEAEMTASRGSIFKSSISILILSRRTIALLITIPDREIIPRKAMKPK